MSCKEYITAHKYMSDEQKDAMYELWKSSINHDGHAWVTFGDVEKTVAKLMKKQIPTKPYAESWGDADGYPVWEYSCPVCGFEFGEDGDYLPKYCPDCGQLIDLEEVEE